MAMSPAAMSQGGSGVEAKRRTTRTMRRRGGGEEQEAEDGQKGEGEEGYEVGGGERVRGQLSPRCGPGGARGEAQGHECYFRSAALWASVRLKVPACGHFGGVLRPPELLRWGVEVLRDHFCVVSRGFGTTSVGCSGWVFRCSWTTSAGCRRGSPHLL